MKFELITPKMSKRAIVGITLHIGIILLISHVLLGIRMCRFISGQ